MRISLILTALALVASACTGGGETEETSPQGTGQDNGGTPAPDTPVELSFKVWSFSIETILDNIAEFEEANPNITVNLADVPWPDYPSVIASDFSVGNPPDIL
ncbi:MAG: extracellular solute-binding protein, partial [Chloroflexi bacterium]|nr:extracellular solute-binding protein [Chloroflexota bacterium]